MPLRKHPARSRLPTSWRGKGLLGPGLTSRLVVTHQDDGVVRLTGLPVPVHHGRATGAVSYTHLDVYKRQEYDTMQDQDAQPAEEAFDIF